MQKHAQASLLLLVKVYSLQAVFYWESLDLCFVYCFKIIIMPESTKKKINEVSKKQGMQVNAKLPTLGIDSPFQPNSADGEWMQTELSNQISYKTLIGCRKGEERQDWKCIRGLEEPRRKHTEWLENKKSPVAAICSCLRLHYLFQCNFNHAIMLAMSTDRSDCAKIRFFSPWHWI